MTWRHAPWVNAVFRFYVEHGQVQSNNDICFTPRTFDGFVWYGRGRIVKNNFPPAMSQWNQWH